MNGERSISLIGTGPVGGRGTEEEEPSLNTDTAVEWSAEKRLYLSVIHMEIEEGGCPPTHTFFWSCRGILQRPRVEELLPGLLCLQSEWIIELHLCLVPPTLLPTDLPASSWLLCLPCLHHAPQFVCSLCVLVHLQPILVLQGGASNSTFSQSCPLMESHTVVFVTILSVQ